MLLFELDAGTFGSRVQEVACPVRAYICAHVLVRQRKCERGSMLLELPYQRRFLERTECILSGHSFQATSRDDKQSLAIAELTGDLQDSLDAAVGTAGRDRSEKIVLREIRTRRRAIEPNRERDPFESCPWGRADLTHLQPGHRIDRDGIHAVLRADTHESVPGQWVWRGRKR